jgi:hypothetical protein
LAQSEERFERAQVLRSALDPLIDICVRIGVHSVELEALVRVEFVRRLAETLPGNLKTGRGPSHEEIGLAAGLNRGEVQNILAKGLKSAELRMKKKASQHSKSERILRLWSQSERYLSTSGLPLDLPLDLQAEGPSFTELVDKALPGKLAKTVLKDLRRRGLVQLLPDEIVRYRRAARGLPTELNATALKYAADQMRLLGNTLLQTMDATTEKGKKIFGAYVASEPIEMATSVTEASQPAMQQRIATFVQAFELEFGRKSKSKTKAGPSQTIGVSVYTWRRK